MVPSYTSVGDIDSINMMGSYTPHHCVHLGLLSSCTSNNRDNYGLFTSHHSYKFFIAHSAVAISVGLPYHLIHFCIC